MSKDFIHDIAAESGLEHAPHLKPGKLELFEKEHWTEHPAYAALLHRMAVLETRHNELLRITREYQDHTHASIAMTDASLQRLARNRIALRAILICNSIAIAIISLYCLFY